MENERATADYPGIPLDPEGQAVKVPGDGDEGDQPGPAMSDNDVAILSDLLGVKLSERGKSRVQVIIATVDAMLEEHGEQDLRIADVAKQTGASTGTIYHFFGSREGLIKAARAHQYLRGIPTTEAAIATIALQAASAEEFADQLVDVIREVQSSDRAQYRLKQAEFLGSAVSRPDLFAALRTVQTDLLTSGEAIAAILLERGWVRDGISARSLVTLILTLGFGRIVGDLDLEPVDAEEWVHVVELAMRGVLALDDSDRSH
jgi:AcrR family transcriptional regulator